MGVRPTLTPQSLDSRLPALPEAQRVADGSFLEQRGLVTAFKTELADVRSTVSEEMRMLGPDWHQVKEWKDQTGCMNPQWGPYREIWHLIRETGESALIPLMMDSP